MEDWNGRGYFYFSWNFRSKESYKSGKRRSDVKARTFFLGPVEYKINFTASYCNWYKVNNFG